MSLLSDKFKQFRNSKKKDDKSNTVKYSIKYKIDHLSSKGKCFIIDSIPNDNY